jgi:hypothetical protein
MLNIRIFPVIEPGAPLLWDVHTYMGPKLVLIEKLSTAKAQRRLDQARVDRARAEAVFA